MEISADLREAVAHQRHVRDDALYKSTVLHSSGVAEPVDLSGLDFAQSNWTPAVATAASIMRGNVHKTDVNGRKSWRQLCCLKSMPPDDDDDDCPPHGSVRVRTRLVDRIWSEVRVRVRTRLVSWIGSGVRVRVRTRLVSRTGSGVRVRVRTRLVSRIGSEVRVRVRTRLVSRTGSGVRVNVSFRIFDNTKQHQARQRLAYRPYVFLSAKTENNTDHS